MDNKYTQNNVDSQAKLSQHAHKSVICWPMDMGALPETQYAYLCAEKVTKTPVKVDQEDALV